ncbi:nuclear pore complex protein Nup214 isoform X2 [Periophthalmus magnuspinnatus]|uniref:nuclear pore complex protein Nup214 isoform X2 n=1 Tax=Periophthalmus magnuspinnatus TaxID=409849 RepID=UPI00145BCC92|nr:nuclear pore complex protein Nup214 isoform X2 [Periophthalmus magnuspinnatus]
MSDDTDSPPEREMKDFQFRQMKKIRVFEAPEELPKDRSNLLAISNKFGFTFVGFGSTLKVFLTQDLLDVDKSDGKPNEIIEGIAAVAEIAVGLLVHHIALSCDEVTLSVCGVSDEVLSLAFYDVRTFINKNRAQKLPFAVLQPTVQPNILVQDLRWNPVAASMLAVCLSDGSLMILDVGETVVVQGSLPNSTGITSICWSPKGKQIAAGKMDATVCQYIPTLEEKKRIPCPNFYTPDNPVKVLDVLWLRTFVFAVVYAAADGSPETPPDLVVVSLPKKEEKMETKYLNFSDPVYGNCTERQHHYFLSQIEDWDLFFAASAASLEVCPIARQDDKNWELWILEDSSRAELPVTETSEDTFPLGLAIDFTNQQDIRISDEKTLPPAPVMLVLSTHGLLCPFSLLNLNPGMKQLVSPPTPLSLDGERLPKPGAAISQKAPPSIASASTAITASVTPSPPAPAMPPAAPFSTAPAAPVSSSGFTFSVPSTCATSAPSAFSLGASTAFGSGAPSFSFVSKPPSETPSALSAFSFSTPSTKPLAATTSAPSPQTVATPPAVKLNLNERSSSLETTNPAPQPFSFISSAPKTIVSNSSNFMAPSVPAPKPPAVLAPVRPVQTSTPATVVQKPTPTAQPPAQTSQGPVSVKSLEKQLQQKKDSDPIMAGIFEEIAHFQKELDDLKARSAKGDFKVGTNEEMKELRKESENMHVFTLEIKESTESLHGDNGMLKTTLLEGFAGAEEAKAQSELSKDRNYRHLLYKRPLDPRSDEQLKEIRRLYNYVMFAVEDVNDVLDVEWEKHLEKKKKQKHMVVPGRESLFTTLSNNQYIINQQKNRLDQLVKQLTSLHLYNKSQSITSSTSATTSSMDGELENLRDALLKAKLESSPKDTPKTQAAKISPVKQSQLRNFLSKGQMPPVRSTAPANLSRSAFLSPKYYEDLEDVSSTSSVSQYMDPNPRHLELEEEEEEEEELQQASLPVIPPTLSTPRHPTVVRTPSIQPGFGAIQSTPLAKLQSLQGMSFGLSPIPSPVPSNKINLSGAESTALATKTVKHLPEGRTPVPMSAQQAAGTAAMRRQMAIQKPAASSATLTESTLKTVPQVVNVQELKDKGPVPVSSVIGSSVSNPVAQVVQQVLTAVPSNQVKRIPSQVSQISTDNAASPQTGFVFGMPTTTSAAEQNNSKGFSFTSSSTPFSFTSGAQGSGNSQAKEATSKFSFGSNKAVFGSTSEEQFSLTPKSTSPAFGNSSAPSTTVESVKPPSSLSALLKEPQHPKTTTGDTLGVFTDIRLGQGEAKDTLSKPAFSFGEGGLETGKGAAQFNFGAAIQKTIEESTGTEQPKDSLFKPPDSTTKQAFSVAQSSSISAPSPTSFVSLLSKPSPSESSSDPKAPAPVSEPTQPPEKPAEAPNLEPAKTAVPEPETTETTQEAAATAPVPDNSAPSPAPPAAEALQTSASPAPEPSSAVALPTPDPAPISVAQTTPSQTITSETPGSIFTQPLPATTDSTTVIAAPVINTVATTATTPTPTAVITATTTAPVSVFGQPAATPTSSAAAVPSTAAQPTAFTSAGFGSGVGTGFGAPVFGQVSGFGQPVSSSGASGGFSFGQTSFGASPNTSTSGGLFGVSTASNVSSFSFGTSNANTSSSVNTASSTGTGLFGQSTATPVFGQSSGFGQASVFGSNTTTSSSSGFSFAQQSVFGSNATPAFGQQTNTGSVFGQQPSTGGSLFGSTGSTTGSSGGGFFSGLGGKPSEDAANKNPFGSAVSTVAFGQPAQTGNNSLFGNSGAKGFSFGQSAFGEQKSTGTFSAGGGSVAAQGFGSFASPTKPGGFGSAPVFGSPPSFGGSPAFGTGASFGTAPSFNSPLGSSAGKVFGEGTAASSMGGFGFGSSSNAPTFGALANQSAPSFGGLTQQGSTFGTQPSSFSGFGQQQQQQQQQQSGGFSGNAFGSSNQSNSTFSGWR